MCFIREGNPEDSGFSMSANRCFNVSTFSFKSVLGRVCYTQEYVNRVRNIYFYKEVFYFIQLMGRRKLPAVLQI